MIAMEKNLQLGLSQETLEEIARAKAEPRELLTQRLRAWELAQNLPLPESRFTRFRKLNLGRFQTFAPATTFLPLLPQRVRDLLRREDISLLVQVNSDVVLSRPSREFREKGGLLLDLDEALRKHPDRVQPYLARLVAPDENKFAALTYAFRSGGAFVHVPEKTAIESPLFILQVITEPDLAIFTPMVVILEQEARFSYVVETFSPPLEGETLACETHEVFVGEGAEVHIGLVQNWNRSTWAVANRKARLARDGKVRWATAWMGSRLLFARQVSLLEGDGSDAEDVQVFFTDDRQHFDIATTLDHIGLHTRGEVLAKGALKERSRSIFYGMIKIEPGAQHADSYLSDHALMLNPGARADSIPGLEIEANQVRATHGATTGQIDPDQVFYLMTRGLPEKEAKKLLVEGFLEPAVSRIPIPAVKETLLELIESKWESAP